MRQEERDSERSGQRERERWTERENEERERWREQKSIREDVYLSTCALFKCAGSMSRNAWTALNTQPHTCSFKFKLSEKKPACVQRMYVCVYVCVHGVGTCVCKCVSVCVCVRGSVCV